MQYRRTTTVSSDKKGTAKPPRTRRGCLPNRIANPLIQRRLFGDTSGRSHAAAPPSGRILRDHLAPVETLSDAQITGLSLANPRPRQSDTISCRACDAPGSPPSIFEQAVLRVTLNA